MRSDPMEGITSGAFRAADKPDFVKWEPMRESDPRWGSVRLAANSVATRSERCERCTELLEAPGCALVQP